MMQALMYTEARPVVPSHLLSVISRKNSRILRQYAWGLGQFWTPMVDQFSMPMAACIEGRQKKNPLRETRKGFRK
jgi:hypothetical protein